MKPLRTFRLEEYLGEWEFKVRHHLTASDAAEHDRGGTAGPGHGGRPRGLHEAAAVLHRDVGHAGAARGGRRHLRARRRRPRARLRRRRGGALLGDAGTRRPGRPRRRHRAVLPGDGDGDAGDGRGRERAGAAPRETAGRWTSTSCARLLRPTTKLVAVNFPNNPTGHVPDEATFRELVALCDERGIRLFCDEVYRGIEVDPARTITQAADLSETAALAQRRLQVLRSPRPARRLARLPRPRRCSSDWRSASTTRPSAMPVPRSTWPRSRCGTASDIWARNRGIVAANRPLFDDFFARWAELFDWQPPVGGCVCFPRYKGGDVEDFCRAAARRRGRAGAAGEHVLLGDRRRADRPLPCRNRQAGPRGWPGGLRPLPAAPELNSLQAG